MTASSDRAAAKGRRGTDTGRRRRPGPPPLATLARRRLLVAAAGALVLAAAADPAPRLRRDRRRKRRQGHERDRESEGAARRLLSPAAYCPGSYTGVAPTEKCKGYLECKNGKPSSDIVPCAGGTVFDVTLGTCAWPDSVDCRVGTDLLDLPDQQERAGFCPARYSGRAPTAGCKGYVECRNGREGLSVDCPPQTKFNSVTTLCEYDLDVCQMLVDDDNDRGSDSSDEAGVFSMDQYCPIDYNGRAPMNGCSGFVDCVGGRARRSKNCPKGTLFDVMVLACTYAATGCDEAGEAPTFFPTYQGEEPREGGQDREEEEQEVCSEGHTGYVALVGCQQYVYCSAGTEMTTFDCAPGTLFTGQTCTWADQVDCQATQRPSRSPVTAPTYAPTVSPTEFPTELDIYNQMVYYPDFSAGVCRRDGLFPPDIDRAFLFVSNGECCAEYFPMNLDACETADDPTPAPVPAREAEWYPDTDNDRCVNNADRYPGEWVPLYYTYKECCGFPWLDEVKCLRQEPVIQYYPDYSSNTCKNDGRQSPYEENLFDTIEECCRFEWIDHGLCIIGSSEPNEGMQQLSAGYDADRGDTGVDFYPDYINNVCHCDGKQGQFEVNLFTSFKSCCEFALIDTNVCLQYRHHAEHKCVLRRPTTAPTLPLPDFIWYPDMVKGLCRDDGRGPGMSVLAHSLEECCQRFMPTHQEGCEERSQRSQMAAFAAAGLMCRDQSKKKCAKQDGCEWDLDEEQCRKAVAETATAPSPTATTSSPPRGPTRNTITLDPGDFRPGSLSGDDDSNEEKCFHQTNKKICARVSQCRWDVDANRCTTSKSTLVSTASSRSSDLCSDQLIKKRCAKIDHCQWDEADGCIDAAGKVQITPRPTPKRTPSPVQNPKKQCHDQSSRKQCTKVDHCEWDRGTEECFEVDAKAQATPGQVTPDNTPSRTTSEQCSRHSEDNCQNVSDCQWDENRWPRGQCVPSSMATYSETSQSAMAPSAAACSGKNKKQCAKAPDLCLYDFSWKTCRPLALPSNVYYPDYFHGVCRHDSKHHGLDMDQLYNTAAACCRNPWIYDYVVCMTDMSEDAFAGNLYYPDYSYDRCLNDGQQSPLETNLFDTLEECCDDEWINYDSCMSNARR